jgi:hypothetical protein
MPWDRGADRPERATQLADLAKSGGRLAAPRDTGAAAAAHGPEPARMLLRHEEGRAGRQPTAGPGDASVNRERGARTASCGLILIRFIDIARTICYRWKRVKIWEERQPQRVKARRTVARGGGRLADCWEVAPVSEDALAASHACDADSQVGCRLQDRETDHGTTCQRTSAQRRTLRRRGSELVFAWSACWPPVRARRFIAP